MMACGNEDINRKYLWPWICLMTEDSIPDIVGQAYRIIRQHHNLLDRLSMLSNLSMQLQQ